MPGDVTEQRITVEDRDAAWAWLWRRAPAPLPRPKGQRRRGAWLSARVSLGSEGRLR